MDKATNPEHAIEMRSITSLYEMTSALAGAIDLDEMLDIVLKHIRPVWSRYNGDGLQMVTVETGVVCQPKSGEAVSGDSIGLWRDAATTLVAVVDSLGSGQAAARAAQAALTCVEMNRSQPLPEIVACCHGALQATRGVVMGLARVEHRIVKRFAKDDDVAVAVLMMTGIADQSSLTWT